MEMLHALGETPYAQWVKESWGWAAALTIHAFGNAIVVGLVFIIGLRLFGFFRTVPIASVLKFFPAIWIAAVFQVASGITLWMTKPDRYVKDPVFDIKFTLVVVGLFVVWHYQKFIAKRVGDWQAAGKVSSSGMRFAALTCTIWAFVLVMGRLTAYLGSLYDG
jgi:hypothetical protein